MYLQYVSVARFFFWCFLWMGLHLLLHAHQPTCPSWCHSQALTSPLCSHHILRYGRICFDIQSILALARSWVPDPAPSTSVFCTETGNQLTQSPPGCLIQGYQDNLLPTLKQSLLFEASIRQLHCGRPAKPNISICRAQFVWPMATKSIVPFYHNVTKTMRAKWGNERECSLLVWYCMDLSINHFIHSNSKRY